MTRVRGATGAARSATPPPRPAVATSAPSHLMSADDAVEILAGLSEHGVDACVGGGWAVDALLGEQTRDHSDLDTWVTAGCFEELVDACAQSGVDRLLPYGGNRPWNFVLHDGGRRRIDLHLYEAITPDTLHYGSAWGGVSFPAEALTGGGSISGVEVRCETPQWSMRWHCDYPLRPVDRHDVPLLCERFGIALPEAYR